MHIAFYVFYRWRQTKVGSAITQDLLTKHKGKVLMPAEFTNLVGDATH